MLRGPSLCMSMVKAHAIKGRLCALHKNYFVCVDEMCEAVTKWHNLMTWDENVLYLTKNLDSTIYYFSPELLTIMNAQPNGLSKLISADSCYIKDPLYSCAFLMLMSH